MIVQLASAVTHPPMRQDGGWDLLGDAAEVNMGETQKAITQAITSMGKPLGVKEIASIIGRSEPATKMAVGRMVTQGNLTRDNGKYSLGWLLQIKKLSSHLKLPSNDKK